MPNNPSAENVIRAQDDRNYREQFIAENIPYIRAEAARAIHHPVSEHDDEWSVALIAFNEAIDRYIPERGSFSAFAGMVIERRLMDELRRDYRRQTELPVSPEAFGGEQLGAEESGSFESHVSTAAAAEAEQIYESSQRDVKAEIAELSELLEGYGFGFFDLAEDSPKAEKTKRECAKAIGVLLSRPELFSRMREAKALPQSELIRLGGVKKKILERHRRYIIAAAEILNGEYPLLAVYMESIRKALKT